MIKRLIPVLPALLLAAGATASELTNLPSLMAAAIGLLEDRHAVYEAGALGSNVLAAVIEAIDPLGGAVLTPEEAARRQDRERGVSYGLDFTLDIRQSWPEIAAVDAGSPAADAGLAVSNRIVRIDGRSTEKLSLAEVSALLRGDCDEPVELAVQSGPTGAPPRTLTIRRTASQTPATGTMELWPQEIGYLKVNGLFPGSGAVLAGQIAAWQQTNCFGIILDLRGANGIDLESAAAVGSLFASPGDRLFFVRDGRNAVVTGFQARAAAAAHKPVMALIDGDTAGAAEVLAGVLGLQRGAMLIGAPTRGDNRLREALPLDAHRVLYVATRRLELADGPDYYRRGVAPHVSVAAGAEPAESDDKAADDEPDLFDGFSEKDRQDRALRKRLAGDPVLRRAADILLGLKALDVTIP